jgi:hypothetical protein
LESFKSIIDYIYNKAVAWGTLSVLEMFDVNMAEKYQIKVYPVSKHLLHSPSYLCQFPQIHSPDPRKIAQFCFRSVRWRNGGHSLSIYLSKPFEINTRKSPPCPSLSPRQSIYPSKSLNPEDKQPRHPRRSRRVPTIAVATASINKSKT